RAVVWSFLWPWRFLRCPGPGLRLPSRQLFFRRHLGLLGRREQLLAQLWSLLGADEGLASCQPPLEFPDPCRELADELSQTGTKLRQGWYRRLPGQVLFFFFASVLLHTILLILFSVFVVFPVL